ncbi:MAG: hypothetical protein B6D44_07050 [Ignavibacteriales bacterium UTCHB2]|jgi:glycine cleavage system H lipoate-binding protein|nr:MAG: Glycine cleavage system H protein [Ignavibacteria bacterium ADurb.Bin266]OQY73396.1 MAG: hypothetical protein B6D44_07050 [Ignavibacteriales bacterium UTCHB2]HQI40276.1 hypothetical protein [Ignavibacteriaceae bacterium]HQJ45866.1 hypothetical protein [Ignavibacteriaceae bacterium]
MVAIFVLAAFLFFILVDLVVLKFQGKYHPAFEPSFSQFDISMFETNKFTIPQNTFFSKGHTWLKEEKNGLVNIGIDEFGMTALGTLAILNCALAGKTIKRGDILFEGAYGNNKVKFLSPVNGIVQTVNPNIINKNISDPYKTWGVQLLSKDLSENHEKFYSGNDAVNWIKKEFIKLKSFLDTHALKPNLAGETMFDGGTLSNDMLYSLVDKSTSDFEKEFLSL